MYVLSWRNPGALSANFAPVPACPLADKPCGPSTTQALQGHLEALIVGLSNCTPEQLIEVLLLGHVDDYALDGLQGSLGQCNSLPIGLVLEAVRVVFEMDAELGALGRACSRIQRVLALHLEHMRVPVSALQPALCVLLEVGDQAPCDVLHATLHARVHRDPLGLLRGADDAPGNVAAKREGQAPLGADAPPLEGILAQRHHERPNDGGIREGLDSSSCSPQCIDIAEVEGIARLAEDEDHG
mmetsp:Transcript_17416/g.55128  ORF Transcript_17416/g.55128 Transcript_17416/m.55128 type:complete len:242 (-) Transcript_17416:558-1283(-)